MFQEYFLKKVSEKKKKERDLKPKQYNMKLINNDVKEININHENKRLIMQRDVSDDFFC